jgi:hypothetical protein
MPIHDWTRVAAGIFHDFHHAWIEQIKRSLNSGVLPPDYYAMVEQHAAGFGPDVLTLQGARDITDELGGEIGPGPRPNGSAGSGGGGLRLATPPIRLTAETEMEFYHRKQKVVAVRHVSGDRVVAIVEVVSPGNKSHRSALLSFVEKAGWLIERRIHLLVLDLFPPGPCDPNGIHSAIWEEVAGEEFAPPAGKPLTLVAYESSLRLRAFIEPVAVGDTLPDMPLFLEPGGHVVVPLEATYRDAFDAVPRRWRGVLESS